MFESQEDGLDASVRPIKYRAFDHDDAQGERDTAGKSRRHRTSTSATMHLPPDGHEISAESTLRCRLAPKPNFLLEYSYPAVILEDVCFSVDKSQQQANFLKEVIFRLNQACAPLCLSSGAASDYHEKVQILKSINLSVPRGSIFGLLGPSSCGKTTLLRCLLGLLKPSSGCIRLFGKRSSATDRSAKSSALKDKLFMCVNSTQRQQQQQQDDCKVPGPNVGYMPQDLGLYEDFTIAQLLTMFGRYMRMELALIKTRIEFMASFLELPDVNRQVQTLSGGQKRRVSFAIACLHMPPLIILDEPTVGVDPLLRRSIWKYLRRLASEENKTIIITTHYIEEAAQADQVALMRAGEVLVQDAPRNIMRSNNSRTLEEAFLKICSNVSQEPDSPLGKRQRKKSDDSKLPRPDIKLLPQPQFNWHDELGSMPPGTVPLPAAAADAAGSSDLVMEQLKLRAQEKLAFYDKLRCCQQQRHEQRGGACSCDHAQQSHCAPEIRAPDTCLSTMPDAQRQSRIMNELLHQNTNFADGTPRKKSLPFLRKHKFILNEHNSSPQASRRHDCNNFTSTNINQPTTTIDNHCHGAASGTTWRRTAAGNLNLFLALLYKNYRRNVNSIPLLVFQFMLPMIQMISFCLCVGGRPTNVGLGIVNHDAPLSYSGGAPLSSHLELSLPGNLSDGGGGGGGGGSLELQDYSLSSRYLGFLDTSMLSLRPYDDLSEALSDVRRSVLWAVLEIGQNFSDSLEKRFDLENFYQLDKGTIDASVIRIYPDRSNKILDAICHRSLVDSYRAFLSSEFEHFKRLPIEIARPIFDIKPNLISNSIDGYTESIAPGLLASLTYIMAAGLTTFIMVVERSDGILERTYTSGINPISYLVAHAIFRSFVMMIQIALVLVLTFYILKQPIVGSIWLAYAMLMVLNITGIAYGLLISSIVTDQNGAALTIVSSLVVKITLSGILWPFEAIPYWLRTICYFQPLTMPVQALKSITLKGASLGDSAVNLGFLVSVTWLVIFLTISAKRFKFYQH